MKIEDPQDFLENAFLSKAIKYKDDTLFIFGREGAMINMDLLVTLTKHLIDEEPAALETAAYTGITGIINDYNARNTEEDRLKLFVNVLSASGFGFADISKGKEGTFVHLNGCALAKVYLRRYGQSDKPVCHIIRGFLRQTFDVTYGSSGKVEELECIAQGKADCFFLYKVPE